MAEFPSRLLEMSRKLVVLAGLQLRQQLLNGFIQIGQPLDERCAVHGNIV